MNQKKEMLYFQYLFNDASNPACFAHMESYELLFMNRSMAKLLGDYDDYTGKKCYEVIYGREAPCSFCPNFMLEQGKFIENYIFNANIGKNFNVVNTLLDYQGQKINMCKYITTPVYSNQQLSFEEAMIEYANIFSTVNENAIFDALLGLLGSFYQCRNSYLYGLTPKDKYFHNLNIWCSPELVHSPYHVRNQTVIDTLLHTMNTALEDGVLEMGDLKYVFSESSEEFHILDRYQIENLLLCPVHSESSQIVGFLAVVNRKEMACDMRLLKSVARFVEENFSRHKPF